MVFVLFLFIMAGVCLSTSNMQGVQAYIIFLYILYIYLYIYIYQRLQSWDLRMSDRPKIIYDI